MERIRNSRYSSTEMFLAAKVKNVDLKWKDIFEALLSIGECELAGRVCVYSERGQSRDSICTPPIDAMFLAAYIT